MMSEIAGAAWVLPLTFALQGISAALILTRLVRGPRAADRVVAMLINEAADAVYRGIGSEADVETAMLKGVNYPKGLIAWGREWGWTTVRDRIEALHRRTGDTRYRVCPWIHDQISAQ